jgi:hypothetical protein
MIAHTISHGGAECSRKNHERLGFTVASVASDADMGARFVILSVTKLASQQIDRKFTADLLM